MQNLNSNENENENVIEDYCSYVESIMKKYSKASRLIDGDEVTPYSLNSSLANYLEVNMMLLSEYQRVKVQHYYVVNQFNQWYDIKFSEVRNKMNNESKSASTKISVKEYETQLRVDYQREYNEWQDKIKKSELKVSYLRRLADLYKKFDSILVTLSSNMRTEIRSLNVGDRMSADPEVVTRSRVRKEFPTNNI